ncbi:MAG: AAA family ATPase [Verrucomicrobiota bacterium]
MIIKVYTATACKPFVILTGNSGTGKTKVAELLAHHLRGKDSDGYELVAVGADWTDNRNVLGFVNNLKENDGYPVYHTTRILDLLLRAKDDPSYPYFLILDEMNLSHVERYFSDFLSVMESKAGVFHLHSEGDENGTLPAAGNAKKRVPKNLLFPGNVFVIGTVNIDETTYMFSPKVLDRANVIEFRMNPDAVDQYLDSGSGISDIAEADASYARTFLDLSLKARGDELEEIPEGQIAEVNKAIRAAFDITAKFKMEFGFRTMNEIRRYFRVDYALSADKSLWRWETVFDIQLLQKILPKLHGSKRRIEPLLIELAVFSGKKGLKPDDYRKADMPDDTDAKYPKGYCKIREMIEVVRRDQFVSFIQ